MHHYPLKCIDNDTQRFPPPKNTTDISTSSPLYAISKSVSVKRACKFFFTVVSVYSSLVPITFVTCISNARGDEIEVFFTNNNDAAKRKSIAFKIKPMSSNLFFPCRMCDRPNLLNVSTRRVDFELFFCHSMQNDKYLF